MLSHFAVASAEKLANRLILLDPQLQQRLQQINTQAGTAHS